MNQGRSRSPVGGAANWAGSAHECGLAAFLAVHCLAGQAVTRFGLPPDKAVPVVIRLQADEPVDDIVCELSGGGAAYLQAKTRLEHGNAVEKSFPSVVAQWVNLAEERKLDPRRDRVIAVAETASGAIQTLDRILQRGRLSRRQRDMEVETEAAAKLDALLGQLPARHKTVIKRSARIWLESFDDDVDTTVNLAMMLLRPIVGAGHESEGWHRLLKVMADGARLRVGYDADELRDELRLVGIELVSDPPGSPGAARAALVRYRRRLRDGGRVLNFVGLGASIPEVSIEIGDADVEAAEQAPDSTDEPRWRAQLHWWIRRRGRLVLTGLPGSGKSTALRIAAGFYADTPGWPLPILVPLDRLAKRRATQSFRDALLDLATEDASHADRANLHRTLDEAIETGEVLLAFDALDEARERRYDVVRELRDFLRDLDSDLEVVVSTRDSAYADARALGFREVRLLAPREMLATVEAVLAQLAVHCVPEAERAVWVAERVSWVDSALSANTPLRETPLVGVLLAVLASTSSSGRLPTRRGLIMWEVVRAVVARWELAKGGDAQTIGVLVGTRARRALEDAYIEVAATVVRTELPPVSEVVQAVAERLGEVFDLASAEAAVAAEDAVAFWDRSGFFVAHGRDERVSPRLRLFAEVGEARRLTELGDEYLRAWIASAMGAEDRHEALCLACELDARAAEIVVDLAAPHHALLAASCAGRAPSLSDAGNTRLLAVLLQLFRAESDRRWGMVDELIRFAVTAEQRCRVREALQRLLLPKQLTVASAAAVLAWDECGPHADSMLEAVFEIEDVERSTTEPQDWLSMIAVDQLRMRTVVGAVRRLMPGNRAMVERLVQPQRLIGASVTAIREIAIEAGFEDVVSAQIERESEESAYGSTAQLAALEERHATDRAILGWIADSVDHAALTFGEQRRLDHLIDYWTSIRIEKAAAFEPSGVYRHHSDFLRDVLLLLLRLSGVHGGRTAAQASLLLRESANDSWNVLRSGPQMLNMDGSDRRFERWDDVDDANRARDILVLALGVGRWLPSLAGPALAHRGMSQLEQQNLERALRTFPRPQQRTYAAKLRLGLASDKQPIAEAFLADDDPALRSAAGAYVAYEASNPTFTPLIGALLDDPDDKVRANFVHDLTRTSPSGDLLAIVEAADWKPRPWQCSSCGTDNPPGERGCTKCHVAGGDTDRAVHALRERVAA